MCYGLQYPHDLLASLDTINDIPLLPSRTFAELHLSHTLSHPPDHVLFPFLHGLEGDNHAQNTFFSSSGTAIHHARHVPPEYKQIRPKVPSYRGLVWVVCEEDIDDVVALSVLKRKPVDDLASVCSSESSSGGSSSSVSSSSSSSSSYGDDDDDFECEDEVDVLPFVDAPMAGVVEGVGVHHHVGVAMGEEEILQEEPGIMVVDTTEEIKAKHQQQEQQQGVEEEEQKHMHPVVHHRPGIPIHIPQQQQHVDMCMVGIHTPESSVSSSSASTEPVSLENVSHTETETAPSSLSEGEEG